MAVYREFAARRLEIPFAEFWDFIAVFEQLAEGDYELGSSLQGDKSLRKLCKEVRRFLRRNELSTYCNERLSQRNQADYATPGKQPNVERYLDDPWRWVWDTCEPVRALTECFEIDLIGLELMASVLFGDQERCRRSSRLFAEVRRQEPDSFSPEDPRLDVPVMISGPAYSSGRSHRRARYNEVVGKADPRSLAYRGEQKLRVLGERLGKGCDRDGRSVWPGIPYHWRDTNWTPEYGQPVPEEALFGWA